jgi:hypothetical protein
VKSVGEERITVERLKEQDKEAFLGNEEPNFLAGLKRIGSAQVDWTASSDDSKKDPRWFDDAQRSKIFYPDIGEVIRQEHDRGAHSQANSINVITNPAGTTPSWPQPFGSELHGPQLYQFGMNRTPGMGVVDDLPDVFGVNARVENGGVSDLSKRRNRSDLELDSSIYFQGLGAESISGSFGAGSRPHISHYGEHDECWLDMDNE